MVNVEQEGKLMDQAYSTSLSTEAENGLASEYQATLTMLLMNPHDLNIEELAKNLHMVMNENMDLKETVSQNNLALRHQLSLLEQWNLQVENEKENSRSMIEECQRQIRYLRNENQVLKKTLTASQSDSQSEKFNTLDGTIQNLNNDLDKLQQMFKKAQEDKEILRNIRLKVEGENTVLKFNLTTANSELDKIKSERHDFVNMIHNLKENSEKDEAIFRSVTPNKKSTKVQDRSDSTLQDPSYKYQIENLEKQLKISRTEVEKYKALHAELSIFQDSSSLATAPSTLNRNTDDDEKNMLKNEIKRLNEQITYLKHLVEENKQKSGFDQVDGNHRGEIIRLNNLLKVAQEKSERTAYTDQYYQAKIKSLNETYDEATAKIISYEELLATKNDEILRIKKEMGKTKGQLTEVQSERDIIAVLRAQVEVYQADFRAEREAREVLASDREKLRDEMKHLQARNTQMIDELEAYHRRAVTHRGSRGNSEEPKFDATNADFSWEKITLLDKKEESPSVEKEIDENLLYCPKCNKTFTEIGPLEQHVNRCLDED